MSPPPHLPVSVSVHLYSKWCLVMQKGDEFWVAGDETWNGELAIEKGPRFETEAEIRTDCSPRGVGGGRGAAHIVIATALQQREAQEADLAEHRAICLAFHLRKKGGLYLNEGCGLVKLLIARQLRGWLVVDDEDVVFWVDLIKIGDTLRSGPLGRAVLRGRQGGI